MARYAFLVITYTDPQQTERMVRRMAHPHFDFYVHVDAKLPLSSHNNLLAVPQTFLIKNRIDVRWAAYSTVQATLNSVQEIFATQRPYEKIILMSGSDYPIQTAAEIFSFLTERQGCELMKYRSFEGEWEEGMERVKYFHMTDYRFRGRYWFQYYLNRIFPKRVLPAGFKFYGSSMFWALSPQALHFVLNKLEQERGLKNFFRHTWAPDEFLFQSILLNSPFAKQTKNENLHFYIHPPNTPSPQLLMASDWGKNFGQ